VISSVVEGAEITTKSHGLSFKLNYHLRIEIVAAGKSAMIARRVLDFRGEAEGGKTSRGTKTILLGIEIDSVLDGENLLADTTGRHIPVITPNLHLLLVITLTRSSAKVLAVGGKAVRGRRSQIFETKSASLQHFSERFLTSCGAENEKVVLASDGVLGCDRRRHRVVTLPAFLGQPGLKPGQTSFVAELDAFPREKLLIVGLNRLAAVVTFAADGAPSSSSSACSSSCRCR